MALKRKHLPLMVSSTTIDSLQSRSKSGLLHVDVGNTDGERVGHFAQNHQQSTRESRLKARMSRTSGFFSIRKSGNFSFILPQMDASSRKHVCQSNHAHCRSICPSIHALMCGMMSAIHSARRPACTLNQTLFPAGQSVTSSVPRSPGLCKCQC